MSDPRRNPLNRQESKSSLEQTLQMLNPPQQAPITIYPGPSSSNANLSKADLEIAQRLESLRKRHNENIPTEEEMASRLAQIKGLPADHYNRQQTAAYQRPDTRTNVERSDDLLTQVMAEVALDASVPKPEDEIEARLARLRGEEHARGGASAVGGSLEGAVSLPPPTASNSIPRSYAAPSQSRMDNSIGDDLDDLTLDEVEAVMAAASREATNSAQHALGSLEADQELAAAVAVAASNRDKKKKHRKHRKSGDKHDTDSDDSIDLNIEGGKSLDAVKEQEEVQRIIDMYTKRAQKKKERKKKQKEAAAAAAAGGAAGGAVGGAVGGVVDSDSDLEMSSLSDLSSDSEKFSDSSDPISN